MDESLLAEVQKTTKVIRHPILEPYALAEKLNPKNKKYKAGQFDIGENQSILSRLSIWVRGNFFIPDARVLWVQPSYKFLKRHLSEHHYDAIITTGPPHSVHLIGMKLKEYFPNQPWVADFRDPWTQISYYRHLKLNPWADRKHKALEKKVMQKADLVLATSYADAEEFQKLGANAHTITNGFDGNFRIKTDKPKKKKLSYVGVLEQLRNPEVLWEVLDEIFCAVPNLLEDFELHFVGRVDEVILSDLQTLAFNKKIFTHGYLNHAESYQKMKDSDALLLTNFPDEKSKGIIPGKVFEYLSTGNLILSLGPKDADVGKIIQEVGAGKHFGYEDKKELKEYLSTWLKGKTAHTLNEKLINSFTRKNLTQRLSSLLDGLLR